MWGGEAGDVGGGGGGVLWGGVGGVYLTHAPPPPPPHPTPPSSKTFDVIESLFTGFPEHEGRRLSLTHDEPPMRIFSAWGGKREGGGPF